MTNMQSKVYKEMGVGSAGEIAKGFHNYLMLFHGSVKENDNVCAGCFVQTTDVEGIVKGASGNAIDHPIFGVVVKDHFINATDNTAIFNKDNAVTILYKGAIFIETKTPAKVGQYVFLKDDTGALVFDNTDTKEGHTYTKFKVAKGTGSAVNADLGFDIIVIVSA